MSEITIEGIRRSGNFRLLVHICCGPCSVAPLRKLLKGSAEVWGFFHNPNIHPLSEFRSRLASVKELARLLSIDCIYDEEYRPTVFVRGARAHAGAEAGMPPRGLRCEYCYGERLDATAREAAKRGFDAFTSSILYSKYQDHASVRQAGNEAAGRHGVPFLYEDFREVWQEGMDATRELGLYFQKYCGCAYSRIEREAEKRERRERLNKAL